MHTCLTSLAPRSKHAIKKIPGVVDTQNGVDNTISGPATNFQVDPVIAARLGFTPTEVAEDATAILDGLPTPDPMIVNGRPYTVRVRLPDETRSFAGSDPEHRIQLQQRPHGVAGLAGGGNPAAAAERDSAREPAAEITVTGRLEGSDLGTAMKQVQATVAGMNIPSSVRVEYGGTYQEQQKSFHDLLQVLILALALVFGVLLAEFRNFAAPLAILTSSVLSISGVVLALLITGSTDFQRGQLYGSDHGDWYRRQEWHSAAGRGREVPRSRGATPSAAASEGPSTWPREAMLHAAQRRLRPIVMTAIAAMCGMLPLAFALGAGSQMLQPLAIAVIGGLLISVFLSLVVTPAVYYRLTRNRHAEEPAS